MTTLSTTPPFPRPTHRPLPPPPQPLLPAPVVVHAATPFALPDPVLERLLAQRIVFLGTPLDDAVANRITAQLLLLAAEDPRQDITFYLNSPGGSVTAGMAIYDTMQMIQPDVTTWAVGLTAATAQFLLTAGTPGKRYVQPHARILLHQPSAGLGGTGSDIGIRAGVYQEMKREIAEITARQTGQSVEQITADTERDEWFTAEQARAYGLVDHVAGPPASVGVS